jgi:hypothetical protein
VTQNGTVGGNREAKNCCLFEQAGTLGRIIPPVFPHPVDDDLRNGWCNAPANPNDKQTSCNAGVGGTAACIPPKYDGTCNFDSSTSTDLFVKTNGPLRNMYMIAVNGFIDGRFTTFEDTYGDDGINWQGAVGYMVNEAIPGYPPQAKGYGVAIDDMVLEWKEVGIVEDTTTTCATGACATLDIATTQTYQSLGRINITVTDYSPGKPAGGNNDCNHNGVYTDAGIDSSDCDANGVRDVYVQVTSVAEPTGEWLLLNETTPSRFTGNLPVSSAYNSPGTLYVRREGTIQPIAIITDLDPDDGTLCRELRQPRPAPRLRAGCGRCGGPETRQRVRAALPARCAGGPRRHPRLLF